MSESLPSPNMHLGKKGTMAQKKEIVLCLVNEGYMLEFFEQASE